MVSAVQEIQKARWQRDGYWSRWATLSLYVIKMLSAKDHKYILKHVLCERSQWQKWEDQKEGLTLSSWWLGPGWGLRQGREDGLEGLVLDSKPWDLPRGWEGDEHVEDDSPLSGLTQCVSHGLICWDGKEGERYRWCFVGFMGDSWQLLKV